jgi:hypothetical protein
MSDRELMSLKRIRRVDVANIQAEFARLEIDGMLQ